MAVGDGLDLAELERLLPFHVTGTLNNRDARRVERGLSVFPELALRIRQIQRERMAIARLGDNLGSPSDRVLAGVLSAAAGRCASKRRMAGCGTTAFADPSGGCMGSE
jgi:hypothetical protein